MQMLLCLKNIKTWLSDINYGVRADIQTSAIIPLKEAPIDVLRK